MAKTDEPGQKWSRELVRRIGAAMQTARGKRTAKWLSDRTAELGYRVSPTVIAKLDSGHRGNVLSVAELLIIAAALDVSPVVLLFPDLPDGDVEMLPGEHTSSIEALLRFTGEAIDDPASNLEWLAYLSRARREIGEVSKDQLRAIARLASAGMTDEAVEAIKNMAADEPRIRELNRQLAALPGAVVRSENEAADDA